MYLQEIFDLTLTQGQGHMKYCLLHHVPYIHAKFEIATANGYKMHLQENTLFDLDPKIKVGKVT